MDKTVRTEEFQRLVVDCQSKVLAYIYALIPDMNDAQDLLQQTMLQLWEQFDEYDASRSFTAWACTLARYQVLGFIRDKQRERTVFSDELMAKLADRVTELSRDEDADAYREALANCERSLNEADRTLVKQCYREDVSVQRVAEQLNRSPQSICNSLKRIRGVLFECIKRRLAQGGRG